MSSEVPAGWSQLRIGDVLTEHQDRCEGQALDALSLTKGQGIIKASERFGRALHGKDVSRYRHVRRGEVVLDPMLLWDGAIAKLWRFKEGFVSPDYRVYRPNQRVDHGFLDFLLDGHHMRTAYKNNARGTNKRRNRIARSDFLAIVFPSPPLPEQRKIAAILSSVDEAIRATQAVIDQTRRVKEGLLQDLLTRGIGHTRFKQTEIGEIPEGWEVRKLRALGLVDCGKAKNKDQDAPKRPYLRVANVLDDEIRSEDVLTMPFSDDEFEQYRLEPGDILLNEGQSLELVGRPAVYRGSPPDVAMQNALLRWRPEPSVMNPEFAYQSIRRLYRTGVFSRVATQTTSIAHLGLGRFRDLAIPVPPLEEQVRIAAILKSVDDARRADEGTLQQLRENKAALLQDLLTGKVRVTP